MMDHKPVFCIQQLLHNTVNFQWLHVYIETSRYRVGNDRVNTVLIVISI